MKIEIWPRVHCPQFIVICTVGALTLAAAVTLASPDTAEAHDLAVGECFAASELPNQLGAENHDALIIASQNQLEDGEPVVATTFWTGNQDLSEGYMMSTDQHDENGNAARVCVLAQLTDISVHFSPEPPADHVALLNRETAETQCDALVENGTIGNREACSFLGDAFAIQAEHNVRVLLWATENGAEHIVTGAIDQRAMTDFG